MSSDKNKDDDAKAYIVDNIFETDLSAEEKEKLKQDKERDEKYRRQDVFIDRRDTFREDDYLGDERRNRGTDRRDE